MPATQDPNLGLYAGWDPRESGWNTGMDANLRKLGAIVQLAATSRTQTTPPASPADGARYIVAAGATGATGAWAGHDDAVAVYDAGQSAWVFYPPQIGWRCYVEDDDALVKYLANGWSALTSSNTLTRAQADSLYAPALQHSNVRAYLSAHQTISANTFTKVAFDTVNYDALGEFDASMGRFTAQFAGTYMVSLFIHPVAGDSGKPVAAELYRNGVSYDRVAEQAPYNPGGIKLQVGSAVPIKLDAGDYLEGFIYTGGTVVQGIEALTYFAITRLW